MAVDRILFFMAVLAAEWLRSTGPSPAGRPSRWRAFGNGDPEGSEPSCFLPVRGTNDMHHRGAPVAA